MNIHIQETTTGWVVEIDRKTIGIFENWSKALDNLRLHLSTAYSPPDRLHYK